MISCRFPDTISFFEALARIQRASGLNYVETALRANERFYGEEKDPERKAIIELIEPLSDTTVSRVVRGKATVSAFNLKRMALAWDLDEQTYHWLEGLRQMEEPRHHTDQSRSITRISTAYRKKVKSSSQTPQSSGVVPDWVRENPPER